MTLRCVLGKLAAQTPATEEELRAMRAAAWHKQGILVVNAEALRDEWERQCLTNIGNRLFGKRGAAPAGERDHG
ncbi:MAG: hypothetical protein NTW47_22960 [Proteobacteria bacterium]|nr:hypothetical protein [Pseudomonadota bacterium]